MEVVLVHQNVFCEKKQRSASFSFDFIIPSHLVGERYSTSRCQNSPFYTPFIPLYPQFHVVDTYCLIA